MMRWIAAIAMGAAFALAFTLPLGSEAEAKKKAKAAGAKMCTATAIDGKKVSFRCKANEKCCYDGLMAKGNCVPAGQVCF